jgi:hypothetical protein
MRDRRRREAELLEQRARGIEVRDEMRDVVEDEIARRGPLLLENLIFQDRGPASG